MTKKYLMTGLVAVALSGLFSGCSQEIETGVETTPEFNILQNYENAFVARFGQPAEDQDWGFGSVSGTRAVVQTPYVTPSKKTYNAQMAYAWEGVEAAKASGTAEGTFSDMSDFAAWNNSGWGDQFFDVHGTVVSSASSISDETIAALTKVIVGNGTTQGLIPEQVDNRSKALSTGYSIVTKGGPVTLTPIYHNSNSGDRLSYYFYPAGSKPSAAEIKKMPKYSLGNMSDPQHNGETHIYRNTYSLVYVDANGNCSYNFPANYVINFVISNTWNDYHGDTDKIYQEGGITSTSGGSESTETTVAKYAMTVGQTVQCGDEVDTPNAPNDKLRIKFSKAPVGTTTTTTAAPQFAAPVVGPTIYCRSTYTRYTEGNGVKGTLTGGSTCYYFKANKTKENNNKTSLLHVAIRMNGGTLKVCEIGDDWNGTGSTPVTFEQKNWSNETNTGVCEFSVKEGKVYAVYAENGLLGYYGYTCMDQYGSEVIEDKPLDQYSGGPYDCGTVFDNPSIGFSYIHVKLGKGSTVTTTTTPDPINFKTAKAGDSAHPIEGYTYYTEGTDQNGGYDPGCTTYYIRPKEAGILRVAYRLNTNKVLHVEDLGQWGWDNTSGTTLIRTTKDASNPFYGTFDINATANHVYAVYAEGSKLGFFGCELIQVTQGEAGVTSTSQVVWKNIPRTPDYYSDGDLNTEIHTTGYGYGRSDVAANTSHTAVFKGTVDETEYTFIGFEDWIDFDFNDVVFAITGTTPEKPQDPIIIPDDPTPSDDPGTFVCRIIAEDLSVSENSDFDFNDVVFDVFWDSATSTTTIRLRAAGGELPLTVAGHEVHKEFGFANSYPLINTGWDGTMDYEKRYTDFTISGVYNTRELAKGIEIWVTKKGKDEELKNILLTAEPGKVASKICVGRDYEWCRERQDIDDKFHKADGTRLFQQYVTKNLGDDWYKLRGK